MIKELDFVAKMGRLELVNITGSVNGTIQEEVLKNKRMKESIGVGAVLLLHNTSGILSIENLHSPFLHESCFSVHLSIHLYNIAKVFKSGSVPQAEAPTIISPRVGLEYMQVSYSASAWLCPLFQKLYNTLSVHLP